MKFVQLLTKLFFLFETNKDKKIHAKMNEGDQWTTLLELNGTGTIDYEFPIQNKLFPRLLVSEEEEKSYCKHLQELVQDSIHLASYEKAAQTSKIAGVQKKVKNTCKFQSQTFPGDVDAVIDRLTMKTTKSLLKLESVLHSDLLDAKVLKVLFDSSEPYGLIESDNNSETLNAFASVKWMAFQSSQGRNRDVCIIEYTGVALDFQKKKIGFHVFESVDLLKWEQSSIVKKCFNFVRADTQGVYLFFPSDDNPELLDLYATGHYNEKKPLHMSSRKLSEHGIFNNDLDRLISVISPVFLSSLLPTRLYANKKKSKFCSNCSNRFGPLSSKFNCAICGKVFCRKCTRVRSKFFGRKSKTSSSSEVEKSSHSECNRELKEASEEVPLKTDVNTMDFRLCGACLFNADCSGSSKISGCSTSSNKRTSLESNQNRRSSTTTVEASIDEATESNCRTEQVNVVLYDQEDCSPHVPTERQEPSALYNMTL